MAIADFETSDLNGDGSEPLASQNVNDGSARAFAFNAPAPSCHLRDATSADAVDSASSVNHVVVTKPPLRVPVWSAHDLEVADAAHLAASAARDVLRVDVHDASRLEWSVSLPLPAKTRLEYRIGLELQIPSNVFVRHTPWDQLQSFVRLDGAEAAGSPDEATSIDTLRRGALALATTLSRQSEAFAKRSRVLASLFSPQADVSGVDELTTRVAQALAMVAAARASLAAPHTSEPPRVTRERVLIDEYASVRLLEFLAGAGRSLAAVTASRSPHIDQLAPALQAAERELGRALAAELTHRRKRGFVAAEAASLAACERYLDRGSQLKKHFQEVLFLDAETYQVAERIHHIVATVAGVIAAMLAFVWQIALANRVSSAEGRLGSGIFLLAAVAGIFYAARDRMKEIGRAWISGRVRRMYAQRISRYRAPARRVASRDIVASAKESFDLEVKNLPDPLNPESSARVLATLLKYTHRGELRPQKALSQSGVSRVKYVFRYDLSPIFSRLDDATKPVPVFDAATQTVRFVDAPRCYRVPLTVRVHCNGATYEDIATLVLHKRGLDRIERDIDEQVSEPLLDAGIDPT